MVDVGEGAAEVATARAEPRAAVEQLDVVWRGEEGVGDDAEDVAGQRRIGLRRCLLGDLDEAEANTEARGAVVLRVDFELCGGH